ncbi:toprim domain-containing protein [Acidithiobacillus thiooxidans]|uniref:toprim domain-containing protein n=1 Tax=Acidithiobacillus thiooxidans TaxID=930 RepID=UPI003568AAAE
MDTRKDQAELQRFIHDIPLPRLMEDHGWDLDRKESSKGALKYRLGDDVLIVGQKQGRWVYFNPKDRNDNGTVVNFGLAHLEPNLGKLRGLLREYSGEPRPWSPPPHLVTSPAGKQEVERCASVGPAWKAMPILSGQARIYLQDRGLSADTLAVYWRSMRTESIQGHQNVAFAHLRYGDDDRFILSGWERKGPGTNGKSFSGFSGSKGIAAFVHHDRDPERPVEQMHLCESSIDALSKAQLDGLPQQDLYLSTGGGWGRETERALLAAIDKHRPQEIVIGLDADETGRQKATELKQCIEDHLVAIGHRIPVRDIIPPWGRKDWNEILQNTSTTRLHPQERNQQLEGLKPSADGEDLLALIRDMDTGKLHRLDVGSCLPMTRDVHIQALDLEKSEMLLSNGNTIPEGGCLSPWDEQEHSDQRRTHREAYQQAFGTSLDTDEPEFEL